MKPDGERFEGTLILECPKCELKWMEKLNLPMAVQSAVARMRSFEICPACGCKKGVIMLTEQRFRDAYAEMVKLGVTRL